MERPSQSDLAEFIRVIDSLSEFEAHHRKIRGHGLFLSESLPIPEVVRVREWLIAMREGRA